MNTEERLAFFTKLLNCNYRLYSWTYDNTFSLLHTDCPEELFLEDMISVLGFREPIQHHITEKKYNPLILGTTFGLVWISSCLYTNQDINRIYLLGPVFTGNDTPQLLLDKLNDYDLTVKLRARICRYLDYVPIIPTTTLMQYAAMFHYTITEQQITYEHVDFSSNENNTTLKEIASISEEHKGIWGAEQAMLKLIEDGNPAYKDALAKSMSLSNGMHVEIGDSVREQKNNLLVLLTLCSRAAIKGGLNPAVSYSLNDHYAKCIEACNSISELSNLSRYLLEDYVTRVRASKTGTGISKLIQNTCDYIAIHIREALSLEELAGNAGYTKYYFSQRFKTETGLNIQEYILRRRIEEAKLLLASTNQSIQDISDELGFHNRSYFYSCFRKFEGLSPSEYRSNHIKI